MRLRQARREDFFTDHLFTGTARVYVLRSGITGNFCRFKCTNHENFDRDEFMIELSMGGVYVQQEKMTLENGLLSESVEVPVVKATVEDLAFAKAEFRKGIAYFTMGDDGHISNRVRRIAGDSAFGTIAQKFKEGKLFIQASIFEDQIRIINQSATAA